MFLTTHYMDEAERVADRIAVIDHGRIVAQGTSAELKQQTGADSLEAAFLSLTGTTIRDESADGRRPDAPGRAGCGGDERMAVIYILWLRELKRYLRSRAADRGLARRSRSCTSACSGSASVRCFSRPARAAICSSSRPA